MSKECCICRADVQYLRKTLEHSWVPDPNSHLWLRKPHLHNDEDRACSDCWEAYISNEVELKTPHHLPITCMFCPNALHDPTSFSKSPSLSTPWKSLVRKDTWTRHLHLLSTRDLTPSHTQCPFRCRGPSTPFTPHDRQTQGRVFTCSHCEASSCLDCGNCPEHAAGETCEDFLARQKKEHGVEEERSRFVIERYKKCPSERCGMPFDAVGCGYLVCEACKFRFCGRCLIPWVGEGGEYLVGREAHGVGCKYAERKSEHGLKRRFEEGGGGDGGKRVKSE